MKMDNRGYPDVPLIDLASDDPDKITQQTLHAFSEFGLAYVSNHGIPEALVSEAFEWTAKFFALDAETKKKVVHPPMGWYWRGYRAVGDEKASQMVFDATSIAQQRSTPDVKETMELGSDQHPRLENRWPSADALPGFREFITRLYATLRVLEVRLFRLIESGLGLDENHLLQFHPDYTNVVRLAHYPPVDNELLLQGKVERIGAHSDFASLTILLQDKIDGLETEHPHQPGVFIPVPPVPGTVIVNMADLMQRWTNGRLKAAVHRVGAATGDHVEPDRVTGSRYSIVYFTMPTNDTVVGCLPGCSGPDRPNKYEAVVAGDYIEKRLDAIY